VTLYATYSRGSKSQGLNLTNLPATANPIVDPEKVNNYEIGLKSQFLDRTVTLNLAAYRTDVTDYQTTILQQVPGQLVFVNYIANIPSVRSQGFEGDLAWRAAEWLSFTGSIAYTDAKYRDYPNGPTPVESLNPTPATATAPANPAGSPASDFSGKPLAGVPKWSASVGGDVSQPLNDNGAEVYLHGDWSYRSSYYTVASDSRYGLVPAYGIVNARLGVRFGEDGRYDLSVFGRNLFDKDYYQTLGVQAYGLITATLGDPGTYGATFKVRF
jgi:iron complex outermembrane receptor protein